MKAKLRPIDYRTCLNMIIITLIMLLCALMNPQRCCDGGCSSNIPHLMDPDVITVSPFSGSADISPQVHVTNNYHSGVN